MSYSPAMSERVARLLGRTKAPYPRVTCDGCGATYDTRTCRGVAPTWLIAGTTPPGWHMERRVEPEGAVRRRDYCPSCRPMIDAPRGA